MSPPRPSQRATVSGRDWPASRSPATMGLTGSSACVKYLLFLFNLLFVITGIVILSVGAVIQTVYYKYEHFLDDKFFSAPSLLIAVGSIVLIISFLGCCGAVKENHCMIITFSALLVLIFILELAAGIAGYVLEDQAEAIIKGKMLHNLPFYANTTEIREAWDFIQKDLSCCGVTNYTDWFNVFKNNSFPISCCEIASGTLNSLTCNVTDTFFHSTPCLKAAEAAVAQNAVTLGGVGVGIAFVQLLGIILACCLAKSIRMHYETV